MTLTTMASFEIASYCTFKKPSLPSRIGSPRWHHLIISSILAEDLCAHPAAEHAAVRADEDDEDNVRVALNDERENNGRGKDAREHREHVRWRRVCLCTPETPALGGGAGRPHPCARRRTRRRPPCRTPRSRRRTTARFGVLDGGTERATLCPSETGVWYMAAPPARASQRSCSWTGLYGRKM